MTLDIPKFIKKTIEKQMTIQHYDAIVKVFRKNSLPTNIVQKIQQQFGDTYLEDSNFIVFYKGRINKKGLKKLFNVTDKALGEDANRLTEGDFKIFKLNDSDDTTEFEQNSDASHSDQPQPTDDEQTQTNNAESTSNSETSDSSSSSTDSASKPEDGPSFDIDDSTDNDQPQDDSSSEQLDKEIQDEISNDDDSSDEPSDDETEKTIDDDIAAVDDEEQLDKEVADEVNKKDSDDLNEDDVVDESIPVRFFFLKITVKQ